MQQPFKILALFKGSKQCRLIRFHENTMKTLDRDLYGNKFEYALAALKEVTDIWEWMSFFRVVFGVEIRGIYETFNLTKWNELMQTTDGRGQANDIFKTGVDLFSFLGELTLPVQVKAGATHMFFQIDEDKMLVPYDEELETWISEICKKEDVKSLTNPAIKFTFTSQGTYKEWLTIMFPEVNQKIKVFKRPLDKEKWEETYLRDVNWLDFDLVAKNQDYLFMETPKMGEEPVVQSSTTYIEECYLSNIDGMFALLDLGTNGSDGDINSHAGRGNVHRRGGVNLEL